jgi:ribosomal protein S18 acetylase RimI-like enzyme
MEEAGMLNYVSFHRLTNLSIGNRVLIRGLTEQDRDELMAFFHQVPAEDVQFCKQDIKNPRVMDYLLNPENSPRVISLVAVDMGSHQIVANLNVNKGQHAALHVGEIRQILVSRPLQGLGLGTLLLDKLIDLAKEDNLHWLKVEVAVEMRTVLKALQSRGFQIRAIFDDYYVDLQGRTYDVALMMRPLLMKGEKDF